MVNMFCWFEENTSCFLSEAGTSVWTGAEILHCQLHHTFGYLQIQHYSILQRHRPKYIPAHSSNLCGKFFLPKSAKHDRGSCSKKTLPRIGCHHPVPSFSPFQQRAIYYFPPQIIEDTNKDKDKDLHKDNDPSLMNEVRLTYFSARQKGLPLTVTLTLPLIDSISMN